MKRVFEDYVKGEFHSYKEFAANYRLEAPDNFNFAYDVMDRLGTEKPNKRALIWTDLEGNVKEFTFGDLMTLSNKAANFFKEQGISKGDMVMMILKSHYQFWISILALHKIGAVVIPDTHLLTKKTLYVIMIM